MAPKIVLSPTSGIVGTTVTVTGSGYTNLVINAITFDGLVPVHSAFPIPDAVLGAFTMTFVVPADDRDIQVVTVANATPNTASTNFTVLPSLSVSPTFGKIATAGVTATGAGYTAGDPLTGITIGGAVPATETVTAQTVAADGSWTGTFTIPPVPITGVDTVVASTADDSASTLLTIPDWNVLDKGGLIGDAGQTEEGVAKWGLPVVTISGDTVTFDRSEGAAIKKTETSTSKNDPRKMSNAGTNEWDSATG
jgi:hypothetical protein